MIYDHLDNLEKYLPAVLAQQINNFLDHCPSEDKTYYLNNMHVITSSYQARQFADAMYESHFKNIDLQIMIRGTETIYYHPICELFEESKDIENDIVFYQKTKLGLGLPISNKMFMLLFPQDGHLPSVGPASNEVLRKAVFKIRVDAVKSES